MLQRKDDVDKIYEEINRMFHVGIENFNFTQFSVLSQRDSILSKSCSVIREDTRNILTRRIQKKIFLHKKKGGRERKEFYPLIRNF